MDKFIKSNIDSLIERTGSLQTGHFQLASGLHSSRFFRCIKLLETPSSTDFLFEAMAQSFPGQEIETVLGANEAGSILAFEIAKQLNATLAIARQSNHQYSLIDGFTITPGRKVLVVDDITTTGGTAKKLINIVKDANAEVVGISLLATKGLFKIDLGYPVEVLVTLEGMDAISPEDCSLCRQNIPLSQ